MSFLKWYDSRFFWFFMFIIPISFVSISYLFFQNFLYMKPCSICVYIRFYMLVFSFFAIFAWIDPENFVFSFLSIFGVGFACFMGFSKALELYNIKNAKAQIFGSSCGENPQILGFDITQIPIFKAGGDCGYDAPILPEFARPRYVQEFFLNFYSDGWYLIPQYKFIDMSEFCLGFFGLIMMILLLNFISQIFNRIRAKIVASQFNKKVSKNQKKPVKNREEFIEKHKQNLQEKETIKAGNLQEQEILQKNIEEENVEETIIDQNLDQETIPSIFDTDEKQNYSDEIAGEVKETKQEILQEKQEKIETPNSQQNDIAKTNLNDELFNHKKRKNHSNQQVSFKENLSEKFDYFSDSFKELFKRK